MWDGLTMGAYGTGTTCQLCEQNHPTRDDAISCADVVWRGHTPATVLGESIPDTLPDDFALLFISTEA